MFFKVFLRMEITKRQHARIKDSLPVQRQRESDQPTGERNPLCGGTGLQVARTYETVWPLTYDLHAHEPLGQNGVLDRVFEQLQLEQIVLQAISPASAGV
jgi:hypothetical protein